MAFSGVAAVVAVLIALTPRPILAQHQPAGTPPGGSTNSSPLAMEATVVEYQALAGNAAYITQQVHIAINNLSPSKSLSGTALVVGTPSDISAIVQLRIALGQGALLETRIKNLTAAIKDNNVLPCYGPKSTPTPTAKPKTTAIGPSGPAATSTAPAAAAPANPNAFWPFALTNASSIATLIQTLGSLAAVSESVSPAAGSVNDTSLINLVSGDLSQRQGAVVYVPSLYPPEVMATPFGQTLLGKTVTQLETDRSNLFTAADTRMFTKPCSDYVDPTFKTSQAKINQTTLNEIAAEVAAASAMIDVFEASLFGNAAPASQAGIAAAQQQQGPGSNTTPGGTLNGAQGQQQQGQQQQQQGQQQQPTAQGSPPGPSANAAAGPAGTSPQQIVYADYLLTALGVTLTSPPAKPVYLVSVHSLESGGNTLTKTYALGGSRVFFSGGAVSTFSVFSEQGQAVCNGVSYGYRGFISESQMAEALSDATPGSDPKPNPGSDPDNLPTMMHYTSTCGSAGRR